jgi:hypothetical protein
LNPGTFATSFSSWIGIEYYFGCFNPILDLKIVAIYFPLFGRGLNPRPNGSAPFCKKAPLQSAAGPVAKEVLRGGNEEWS